MAQKKIRELFEALSINPKLEARKRRGILQLIEMDEMQPEEKQMMAGQMEEPAPEASADDQAKAAFKSMVCGVFDDDSLDTSSKIKKIKEILMAQEKLLAPAAPAEPPPGEGRGKGYKVRQRDDGKFEVYNTETDEAIVDSDAPYENKADAEDAARNAGGSGRGRSGKGEEEDKKKEEAKESAQLRHEITCRDLIEEAAIQFDGPDHKRAFVKSLVPLTDAERRVIIAERKSLYESRDGKKPAPAPAPRSSGRGTLDLREEASQPKFPETKEQAKRLILQD